MASLCSLSVSNSNFLSAQIEYICCLCNIIQFCVSNNIFVVLSFPRVRNCIAKLDDRREWLNIKVGPYSKKESKNDDSEQLYRVFKTFAALWFQVAEKCFPVDYKEVKNREDDKRKSEKSMLVMPSPFCQTYHPPVCPVCNPPMRRDIKNQSRNQHHYQCYEKPEACKNPPTHCFFHGLVIVGIHCLVVWHTEQLACDWRCRLSSGWSRLWHLMHCADAFSLLWSNAARRMGRSAA